MSRMTVIVQKFRKSSVKKYDFSVGAQSWKIRHKGEWQGDYQCDLSPECGECHKKWLRHPQLPRLRCCWMWCEAELFSSRLLRVTLGEAGVAGGAQFRAIITGQRLAEFNKTTISWSGGIFDKENTKHLSQIAVVFILPGCWNCDVGLGYLSAGHCATMQRIINGSAQKCSENAWYEMYWDVLAALMPQLPEQNSPSLIILMNCRNSRNNNGISRQ